MTPRTRAEAIADAALTPLPAGAETGDTSDAESCGPTPATSTPTDARVDAIARFAMGGAK